MRSSCLQICVMVEVVDAVLIVNVLANALLTCRSMYLLHFLLGETFAGYLEQTNVSTSK